MNRRPLREELGAAINTSDLSGRATTLLNALAVGTDRLGELLLRVKYGNDRRVTTMWAAKTLLIARVHGVRGRVPGPHIRAIVEQAMAEWLSESCATCRGRGFTGTEYGDPLATRQKCPAGCSPAPKTGTFRLPGALGAETDSERFMARVSCPRCGGRGWIPGMVVDSSKTQSCRACNGVGRLERTDNERAEAIAVSREEYDRKWRAKYQQALDIMAAVDSRAGVGVAHALRTLDGAQFAGAHNNPIDTAP